MEEMPAAEQDTRPRESPVAVALAEFKEMMQASAGNIQSIPVDNRTKGFILKVVQEMTNATFDLLMEKYFGKRENDQPIVVE